MNRMRATEREFLPAALELQETPPSPLGRIIIWVIVLFFLSAVTWACLGKSDIVAVARGRVIPGGHSKVIQPLEIGTVQQILVYEGDRVKAGDPLILLDPEAGIADRKRLSGEVSSLRQEIHRLQILAQWLEQGPATKEQNGLPPLQQRVLLSQWHAHQAELTTLEGQQATRGAERESVRQQVAKLEQILPIITRRARKLEQLTSKKFLGEEQYLEMEQRRIETRYDLAHSRQRVAELDAEIKEIQAGHAQTGKAFHNRILQQLLETRTRYEALTQELVKSQKRVQALTLRAPVNGVVQQLEVHTIGAVVTPAQQLMVIVPDKGKVEVEALVSNRDVGFVEEGQRTEVKIDAFPFTRYGVIDATLTNLSGDAITDQVQGLVYKARVMLQQTHIKIDGRAIPLSPGMTVTVEIKTGTRRLIEYFLDPLLRYRQESIRER